MLWKPESAKCTQLPSAPVTQTASLALAAAYFSADPRRECLTGEYQFLELGMHA